MPSVDYRQLAKTRLTLCSVWLSAKVIFINNRFVAYLTTDLRPGKCWKRPREWWQDGVRSSVRCWSGSGKRLVWVRRQPGTANIPLREYRNNFFTADSLSRTFGSQMTRGKNTSLEAATVNLEENNLESFLLILGTSFSTKFFSLVSMACDKEEYINSHQNKIIPIWVLRHHHPHSPHPHPPDTSPQVPAAADWPTQRCNFNPVIISLARMLLYGKMSSGAP